MKRPAGISIVLGSPGKVFGFQVNVTAPSHGVSTSIANSPSSLPE